MLKNHKKLLLSLLVLLLLGLAGWFTFSTYFKKWMETRVAILMADLRKKGATLTYSAVDFTVTPLSIQANVTNLHMKDPKGLIEWQGQEIKLFMYPWERFTLNFSCLGDHKVMVARHPSLPLEVFQLEGAKGALRFPSHGGLENLTFMVDHMSFIQGNHVQPLSLKDLSLHVSNMNNPLNLKVSFSTQLMNVEKLFNKESHTQPLIVTFVGDFSGFKPQFPFPTSLAEWRDGGGVLEVRLLKIDWSPVLAEIEGTLTLDEEMYPLGSFASRLSGYEQAINDMVEIGWIKKKKAGVALFMLDLLASSNEKGEKQLQAPITLQNKRLSIGPASLLKLKPIGKGESLLY